MLMAINGQQEIGDESAKNLHHKAIGASGNQGIDVQVLFPPAEEFFDLPAQFIDQSNVCSRKIMAVGGHLIFFVLHPVPHDPHRAQGLTGSGGCLLYTSDAADEEDSVDLGGRRIIKKKK